MSINKMAILSKYKPTTDYLKSDVKSILIREFYTFD